MSPELAWAEWAADRQRRIEDVLARALPAADLEPEALSRAMRYAVLDGGKRVRPLLGLERCRIAIPRDGELRRSSSQMLD